MKRGRSTGGSKPTASSPISFILMMHHMMLTTNRLHALGLCHFAMVHDSFGVHAADIELLHRVLREEFVRIYSDPVLQNILNELRQAYPDVELPELPRTGDLDIRQVLESPYFFVTIPKRDYRPCSRMSHAARSCSISPSSYTYLQSARGCTVGA